MKNLINEAKRMQQLAGIINKNQQSEAIDISQLVREVIQEFFLNEEEYDDVEQFKRQYNNSGTVKDAIDFFGWGNISYEEAETKMKQLGLPGYRPSSAPGSRGFRSKYSSEDEKDRIKKALDRLEYGPTPPTGIAGVTNYLRAIPGVNIYNIAKSSENVNDFIANIIKIAPKLNNPGSVRGLTKYYEMI